jgi:AcrR family transcriptional regulator
MAATAQVAAERGVQGATITGVIERAGVSRVTFYDLFENFEACFLAVLDGAMRRSTALIAGALEGDGPWQEKAVAGLVALLGFLDSDPPLARICLVEALAAGPAALAYRARELELLKHMVDVAAGQARSDRETSLLNAEAVVTSVAGILHARVVTGEAPPFVNLLGPLVSVALTPYLDTETVAREVARAERLARAISAERSAQPPRPAAQIAIPSGLSNPSAYRARLCLLYLAERGEASNRSVAKGIGIAHDGQMSNLLARLARQGLLTKRSGGPGHANAWSLTPRGEQIAQALRVREPIESAFGEPRRGKELR